MTDGPGYHGDRVVVRRQMDHGMRHHGGQSGRYSRVERGHRVPGYWMQPRFQIHDFGRYGFYQPMYGGRWMRYYDDALLVDPYGQVIDGQWGMKWDEYDPDWRHDDRGIPEYVGTGDYHPDDQDYAWVEGEEGYAGHGGGYHHGQGGYGYTHPQAGAIVITETITTTAPTYEEKVWYEDVGVHHKPRAHKRKMRSKVRRGG